jgi:hypothetical protein
LTRRFPFIATSSVIACCGEAIGRCARVRDPFGNELVLLDQSKGRLATDADGRVIGVEPRPSRDGGEQTF